MKALIATLFGVMYVFSFDTKSQRADHIQSVQLIYNYPVTIEKYQGKMRTKYLIDTITISYYKDYVLYQLVSPFDMKTGKNIVTDQSYFIAKMNEKVGYYFPTATSNPTKFKKDSFLTKNAMLGLSFDLPPDSTFRLIRSVKNKDVFYEVFAARKQNQGLKPDSFYFHYNKILNKVDYSFSKDIDSIKGAKLTKVKMIFNSRSDSPPRYFLWELIETPANRQKVIGAIFPQLISKVFP